MPQPPEILFKAADFVPDLRAEFERQPADADAMILVAVPAALPAETTDRIIPILDDRRVISLSDGEHTWAWRAESLRELFRGDRKPPVLGDYPEAYNDIFMILDLHVLELSRLVGDRRDAEMKEIFSTLRRRTDGRSLGFEHNYMWQAAALVLGTRPVSQAEFEAIMARLERSCRTFEDGPSSRNYVESLQSMFG